jgi:hypothetical protein
MNSIDAITSPTTGAKHKRIIYRRTDGHCQMPMVQVPVPERLWHGISYFKAFANWQRQPKLKKSNGAI